MSTAGGFSRDVAVQKLAEQAQLSTFLPRSGAGKYDNYVIPGIPWPDWYVQPILSPPHSELFVHISLTSTEAFC
jgi:hypothetical protein